MAYEAAAGLVQTNEFLVLDADLFLDSDAVAVRWSISSRQGAAGVDHSRPPDPRCIWLRRPEVNTQGFGFRPSRVGGRDGELRTRRVCQWVVGETRFSSSPFHSWGAGFREAVKLSRPCEYRSGSRNSF
jgi:hypothetical protein